MSYDAVIVGAGPNGLAAALELARSGLSVLVSEASDVVGGGTRSAELTEPGFLHDVCSSVHPLAAASPYFRSLPLEDLGVRFIYPPAPLAHPLEGKHAALALPSVSDTAAAVGEDATAYRRLLGPVVEAIEEIADQFLGPLRFPRHPLSSARFGLTALRSCQGLARRFDGAEAAALLAGLGAHSMLPLDAPGTAGFALFLAALAHSVGWPVIEGGSQRIADALAHRIKDLGGEIRTGERISSIEEIPNARAVLFDLTPKSFVSLARDELPARYRAALERYRYGPGVFKLDWALSDPIPWMAPDCRRAATVHLGGSISDIARSEDEVAHGIHPEEPFVILVQPSLFDGTRAPEGKHTGWAYCHVPSGSDRDMTDVIEARVERYAPGFKQTVIARHAITSAGLEEYNPNYVGGDINGGLQNLRQLFMRPVISLDPYRTPNERFFLCSSATPPGGGVHGMCGYHAARSVLRRRFS